MDAYAFCWYVLDQKVLFDKYHNVSRCQVLCFAKDVNNKTVKIVINGYKPYCYISSDESGHVMMPSTNDLTTEHGYIKIEFDNLAELEEFKRHEETYMAGEEPICMFLATYNLDYTGWFSIPLKKDVSGCYECHVIDIIRSKRETIPKFRVLAFDIEVYSNSGGMPKSYRHDDEVFMISLICNDSTPDKIIYQRMSDKSESYSDDPNVYFRANELDCFDTFAQLVIEIDPDVITGFNIFSFDFKYIYERLQWHLSDWRDMSRIPDVLSTTFEKVSWANASYGINEFLKPHIPGRIMLDTFQYFKRMNIDRHSLQYISETFLNESKVDLDSQTMMKMYREDKLDELKIIASYCLQDSILVIKLLDKFDMMIDFIERAKIMKCQIEDILTRGEQLKVNHSLIFECIRRNVILKSTNFPEWNEPYGGAIVFEPVANLYHNCAILDYQSLYPSIIIANNICPSSYVMSVDVSTEVNNSLINSINVGHTKHLFRKSPKGILPGLLEDLLEGRRRIKDMMKSVDENVRKILDKRQNALKIAANAVYGITGAKYGKYLRHKYCAESISGSGRIYFEKLIDYIKKEGYNAIYGDTDSCIISYDRSLSPDQCIEISEQLCQKYSSKLPSPMLLKYEDFFEKILILSKKKYILYNDGKIKYKGVTNARRGYCKFVKTLYEDVIRMILNEDDMVTIAAKIKYRLDKLMLKKIPYSELVISKSVKGINTYVTNVPQKVMAMRLINEGENITPGTRLEYVFVKHHTSTNQGDKMYRLDEVIKKGLEIDYAYYIEKQVTNTIDQLLGLVGLEKFVKEYISRVKIGKMWYENK